MRRRRLLVLLCLALVVAVAGYHYIRLGMQAATAVRTTQVTLRAAAARSGGMLPALPEDQLAHTSTSLSRLDHALERDPGVWALSHMPWLGPQVVQGRRLLSAGAGLADAAARTSALWRSVQAEPQPAPNDGQLAQLARVVAARPGDVNAIRDDLATSATALAQVQPQSSPLLSRLLPAKVTQLTSESTNLAALSVLVGQSAALLGTHQPRTYLILGLDNIELLPGGGLIGGFGQLSIDGGAVSSPHFAAADEIGYPWLTAHGHFTPAPGPLADTLLQGNSWDLATADWSPDFAVGAAQAATFVADATGRQSDEVIGVDLDGLQRLVDFVGGVSDTKLGVTLPAGAPLEGMARLQFEDTPPGTDINAVHAALAQDLLAKLEALPPSRMPALLEALVALANAGHVQISSSSPALEESITALGWGGGMGDMSHDYLALVDGNVRSTKLNLTLQERLDLHVQLAADGSAVHALTVQYQNDDSAWAAGKDPNLARHLMCFDVCRPGTLGGVYGDYVRAYVPTGSSGESGSVNQMPTSLARATDVRGLLSLGNYLIVPQASASTFRLRYTTDRGLRPCGANKCYSLYLRRQPGTHGLPASVSFQPPDGEHLVAVRVNGANVSGASPTLNLRLDRDQAIELVFAASSGH